ncbi:OLC1v1000575C1 [Oldenlandia corymbosa var. corymbosa]|uniref:OLC1v1000575C1 n=1 Tax=Oldenlandia corymbosa var. corymbosa TaxID=529605 RepID=A0AAV1D6R1_OLDCO|nr:OLC1v1000575C1 [Oldenlandia corymbosa var. corymbosa]
MMNQSLCVEQQSQISTVHQETSIPKNTCHIKCSISSNHPVHKTLATAANLANLLPTGTVLAFRTLTPSFANRGNCRIPNKVLTASFIGCCAIFCFFSSFTDSFIDCEGKLCYGIATFKGLYIFNKNKSSDCCGDDDKAVEEEERKALSRFRICFIDFVHAFVSLFVFLIFALSDSDVQSCFFPPGGDIDALMMNLPLGAGVLSSFLFVIFPTTRRGIGYGDLPTSLK